VAVATGLSQGCQPIGPPHRVTEVVDNVIMGLDGRPALETLKAEAGDIIARDLKRAQGYIHVALPTEGADDPHDYQVRNLLAVDPRRGWLAVGERMDSGDRLMFVRRDPLAAQQDMRRMLRGLARRLDGRVPAAGLYVSCVARGAPLFGDDNGEAAMIGELLGTFPLVGFAAAGEICHDRLYSYTGVLILFL
jgi:small ligand-binding sensory domain FIST